MGMQDATFGTSTQGSTNLGLFFEQKEPSSQKVRSFFVTWPQLPVTHSCRPEAVGMDVRRWQSWACVGGQEGLGHAYFQVRRAACWEILSPASWGSCLLKRKMSRIQGEEGAQPGTSASTPN